MPKQRRFKDLDLDFKLHPISKDVTRKYETSAVIRACRNLVLTNFYDRPFHPAIGSSVRAMLFETDSSVTRNAIRDAIKTVIEAHEPRVNNIEVIVEPSDELTYDVAIYLQVVGIIEPVTFTLTLERTR